MNTITDLFPSSYEASRARFRQDLARVQIRWPDARLASHCLDENESLTIDWVYTGALENNEKIFILTTGEHGIECYLGSAMLARFIDAHLLGLDPDNTGLLLVHAINPWGMKHRRRTNANNVDLNRNFVSGEGLLDPAFNPQYADLDGFLNPQQPIRSLPVSNLIFATRLSRYLLTTGHQSLRATALLGQYSYPKGLHYGGDSVQEETGVIKELYQFAFQNFEQILQLDMHTGYGPRYQMSLVNSYLEERNPRQLSQRFNYPLVVATTPDDFYAMRGDMIDHVYAVQREKFPHKRLYATSFEFGTYGDSALALIRSLRTMIFENQAHWFGASNPKAQRRIRHDFQELFGPREKKWREKAISDADRAFRGILKAEGFLAPAKFRE
ncbi:MAG TPA: M14 family metallopeptidase [Anaerolineales bacterium]